jgi:hypothetical protein
MCPAGFSWLGPGGWCVLEAIQGRAGGRQPGRPDLGGGAGAAGSNRQRYWYRDRVDRYQYRVVGREQSGALGPAASLRVVEEAGGGFHQAVGEPPIPHLRSRRPMPSPEAHALLS